MRPPSGLFARLALGGFSFYYKRKNVEVDDYLKSSTPTFILEPVISAVAIAIALPFLLTYILKCGYMNI